MVINLSGEESRSWSFCFQLSALPLQAFCGDQRMLEQVRIPDCTETFCCLGSGVKDIQRCLTFCSVFGSSLCSGGPCGKTIWGEKQGYVFWVE